MILRLAASLAASAVLAGCSVFGVRSGTETLDYEVVADLGEDMEVRAYPARLAVEARVPGRDASSKAFGLLFDYITGANRQNREVAMTTPVETQEGAQEIAMTTPVETGEATTESGQPVTVMRFFLPDKFTQATAPVPTDDRLRLVKLAPERIAVLRFSGFGFDTSVREEKRQLLTRLEDTVWQPAGEPSALFYDPPWTLPFFRRNEVVVPVTRAES
ncbi:hypothetical protein CKO28_24170 [Rhodovibrio sodomensis]|uniref:Heme-binding protein n=1 Tax=Rhodovibrio sodomensis TaxID=1088 RepID=A0ABS1DP03_9PROT|nr:heme-binding protein [Rhodovibrio sodomensis]MBK1671105.1 hypothetical protein [Rhodovibrio sodomensis]